MKPSATKDEIDVVIRQSSRVDRADVSSGEYQTVIGIVGDKRRSILTRLNRWMEFLTQLEFKSHMG